MSKNKNKTNKKSPSEAPEVPIQRINIKQRPTLILGSKFMSTVNYLHNMVGGDEWSGILFYEIDGTVRELSKMTLTARHIMLKDIGTSGSTEFDYGVDVLDFFDEIPEAEDMKPGLVHSHHNMQNYFSPTDDKELLKNSLHYNYYLSLIVSFDCDYNAKLAIPARVNKSEAYIKDEEGKEVAFNLKQQQLVYVADCDIYIETDNYTPKKLGELIEAKKQAARLKRLKSTNQKSVRSWNGHGESQAYEFGKKSITSNVNPFSDINYIKLALSRLIMGDTTGEVDINLYLALKRMDEAIKNETEVHHYINMIEMLFDDVLEFHFGGATLQDAEEFSDNALLILTDEEDVDLPKDSLFLDELIEFFKLNSSEHMEVV